MLLLPLLLLLPALLACKDKGADTGGFFDDDLPIEIEDGDLSQVQGAVSGVVPTVVSLSWTSPVDGDGVVEWGLDGAIDQASPVQSTGTAHQGMALGLKAGETYSVRAVTVAADGTRYESGTATVTLAPPPAELGSFALTAAADGAREGGFVLTSLLQAADSWMVVLDRDGDLVWFYPATDGFSIPTTLPGRDGGSFLFTQNGQEQDEDISNIQRVSLDGHETTWTRARLGHHSFVELPGNRLAWIGLDLREVEVDGETLYLAGDTIWEIAEGSGDEVEPVEVFNYFDDWGAPYRMCQHFDAIAYGTGAQDWTHANSLMYVEGQDDLYLMSKNLDHLLRIDHQTGTVEWQIGGLESDFSAAEGAWWSHAHMSHLWEGGMVVFDNGYHHEPTRSRVVQYTWDEGARTLSTEFQYTDPQSRFIQLLGDGRLLDNGNLLTAWTSAGLVAELSPAGEVVWQVESEVGTAVGRVTMLDSLYTLARGEAH